LLLGLGFRFVQYLAGGADNGPFDRRTAEVDSYKYRFCGLAGSHKAVPDLIMLKGRIMQVALVKRTRHNAIDG
jgi:hypothetical protein